MDMTKSVVEQSSRSQQPSLLACLTCRRRHLKCNGDRPTCKRCEDSGSDCSYKRSRRGQRTTKRLPLDSEKSDDDNTERDSPKLMSAGNPITSSSTADLDNWTPVITRLNFNLDESLLTSSFSNPYDVASAGGMYQFGTGSQVISNIGKSVPADGRGDKELARSPERCSHNQMASTPAESHHIGVHAEVDTLIDIYYRNFNSAHPFLVPRLLYRKRPYLLPPHLKSIMQFAASHFVAGMSQEIVRNAAENITSDAIPHDGYKVQGLMLFGMVLYARLEREQALATINQAIDVALELGMNRSGFSIRHGMGNSIIEESWRRTWWELYNMDGILATLNSAQHQFRLRDIQNDVPLPCEDFDYSSCRPIPPLRTQTDFLERTFSTESHKYSSLAYKIEAVRLSGNVLGLDADIAASSMEQVEAVEASLANFVLSLPTHKRHVIERDGKVDEVMFSAHNILDCAMIMLHRPRSNLVFVRNYYPTSCTRQEAITIPTSAHEAHTSKAIRAANAISNASAIRTPLAMHSPCFICAIALAVVVHLPAYSIEVSSELSGALKERLQLSISALNSIGETWPMAKAVKKQISQLARDTFSSHAVATGSSLEQVQIQAIDIESMMDDQTWLDELSYLSRGENTMMLENFAKPLSAPTVAPAAADSFQHKP